MIRKSNRGLILGEKPFVLVLLSGGVDSTAVVHFYNSQNWTIDGLFVDYGQASAKKEKQAAKAIADYYHIQLNDIRLSGFCFPTGGFIPARNALLLDLALMNFSLTTGILAIGIHSGTDFPDCTPEFFKTKQKLFDIYSGGRIIVSAPFLSWNKREIWEYCRINKVPIELTYSCELGKKQPCGECASCKTLQVLNAC